MCEKAIGFLSFEDAYCFYCGFVNSHPDEANFRDHLLYRQHGLCVVICELPGQRYVLLQNEQVSIQDLLLELEKVNEENKTLASMKNRYPFNAKSLHSILNSMDTEYDRMALKAVVFALPSRPETYNLGIKPHRAVHFLSKVLSTADESEKALEASSDILKLRTQERMKNVENK